MQRIIGTAVGKTVRHITRLRQTGGQALPGLVVERLLPKYFVAMLRQLPEGIVLVTGTNGKTTTTKMIVELLRANGKRVLTNPTGSNLTRGINSMLINQASLRGRLDYDIAVLELDEAYARLFAHLVPVRWVVALNVTRDQLDRFGEVDTAATMICETMSAAHEGIVVNADDPRLFPAAEALHAQQRLKLNMFSVAPSLRSFFPSDNELVAVGQAEVSKRKRPVGGVVLTRFSGQDVEYEMDGKRYATRLLLSGQHNFQNAAAALAAAQSIVGVPAERLITQLAAVEPAFGRGQKFTLRNGTTLRLVLVKNPAGFRQSLASYLPASGPIMIAINDNIADGRDVSWLWDVDLSALQGANIFCTTGTRAADMALRLRYDDVAVHGAQPDIAKALSEFCQEPGDKLLFTTYTAMLWFHKTLEARAGKDL